LSNLSYWAVFSDIFWWVSFQEQDDFSQTRPRGMNEFLKPIDGFSVDDNPSWKVGPVGAPFVSGYNRADEDGPIFICD